MPSHAMLLERALLRLHGDETRAFLQDLVTNDLNRLAGDTALYAMLLTPQGRYLHDFFLYVDGDAVLMEAEAARLDGLMRKLMLYRLRAKVTIEPYPAAVAVAWGDAAAAFGLDDAPGARRTQDGVIVAVDPRDAGLGVRLIGDPAAITALTAGLGIEAGNVDDYHARRIGLGVPDATLDLVPEKSLPLEVGLDRLNGVDFTKGCYVGQELTARTKYRALLKKRLLPVAIEGDAPDVGTPVVQDGKPVGELRGHVGGAGLALLRLDAMERPAPMTVGAATLSLRERADAP